MTHINFSPPLLRRPVLEEGLDALPVSASPQLHALLRFWSDTADGSDAPSRDRLDAFTLRPWLGHISIYETIEGGRDFRIRLEGTSIVAITGEDWTGKRATEVDAKYGCRIAEFMREVVRTSKPLVHTMRVFQHEVDCITRPLPPARRRPHGAVDQGSLAL